MVFERPTPGFARILRMRDVSQGVVLIEPPVHLLIGGDALDQFRVRLDGTDAWENVTRSTDLHDPS